MFGRPFTVWKFIAAELENDDAKDKNEFKRGEERKVVYTHTSSLLFVLYPRSATGFAAGGVSGGRKRLHAL